MRVALAVISVIVLAIHGVVFYNQLHARWQEHQIQYFEEAAKISDNELVKATLESRSPAIEQVIVRNFGTERVDRCSTCHIAVDDPRFVKADEPLRTHPPIPGHKFEQFGCTICHDGQGRAVDAEHAHEGGEDWPWPLLPKEMIEANCVQCHTEPNWPMAPRVNAGYRLFFERACYTCHTIAGLSYGSIGPELTEVGRKRRFSYVLGKIENPRATNPTSTMPKQDLTPEQRLELATFLKAQQGGNISNAPVEQFVSSQQQRPQWLPIERIVGRTAAEGMRTLNAAAQGEALLPKVGCFACHKLDDRDGRVGPDLAYTNSQRDHAWLMDHFQNPKAVVPGSVMPPYPLPNEIFNSLAQYLLSRNSPTIPSEPASQFKALCARCHGVGGHGDGVIAQYLDPQPRDLTKGPFMKTKTRERLVDSVRNGVPGTSMAPWGRVLTDDQSAMLMDYILANITQGGPSKITKRQVPGANPVQYSDESAARGEATFLNRCWGCHGKKADGHGPNADEIIPRPRNLRNGPFVRAASYARLHESIKYGVQGTAMPAAGFDFALDDQAIGDVINFIYSMNGMGGAPPTKVADSRKEGR